MADAIGDVAARRDGCRRVVAVGDLTLDAHQVVMVAGDVTAGKEGRPNPVPSMGR